MSESGWGSASHHKRELARVSTRRRCRFCPGKVRTTHAGQCNGVTLTSGCEWHMRLWVRDGAIMIKRLGLR